MGSKRRIVKDILPLILKDRKDSQLFVDMFCGGCNVVEHVDGNRMANDKNKYLIAMWEGLQKNLERPYYIPKELYNLAKQEYKKGVDDKMSDFLVGWIGWMASYNGRFFDGGYSGHSAGSTKRDYIKEQIKNTESQIPNLINVKFFSKDYSEFSFKEPCIIYCDIPYKNTKQYSTSKGFNYDAFFDWVRLTESCGHSVYISEYTAPSDFECIWEKEVTNSLNPVKTYKTVEKLFKLKTFNE
jgi:DNA adenine methylase